MGFGKRIESDDYMGKLWLSLVGLLLVISGVVSGCATQTTYNSIVNTSAIVYVPNAVVENMWLVNWSSLDIYLDVTLENTMSCKSGDKFTISMISLDTNQIIDQRTLIYNGTKDAPNIVSFDINGENGSGPDIYQELLDEYFSNNRSSEIYHFNHGESPIQYIKFSVQKQN